MNKVQSPSCGKLVALFNPKRKGDEGGESSSNQRRASSLDDSGRQGGGVKKIKTAMRHRMQRKKEEDIRRLIHRLGHGKTSEERDAAYRALCGIANTSAEGRECVFRVSGLLPNKEEQRVQEGSELNLAREAHSPKVEFMTATNLPHLPEFSSSESAVDSSEQSAFSSEDETTFRKFVNVVLLRPTKGSEQEVSHRRHASANGNLNRRLHAGSEARCASPPIAYCNDDKYSSVTGTMMNDRRNKYCWLNGTHPAYIRR